MDSVNLLQDVQYQLLSGVLDSDLRTIQADHRKVGLNDGFVAIRGAHFDGHSQLEAVLEAGASLVVIERAEAWTETLAQRYPQVAVLLVPKSREALALMARNYYGNPLAKLKSVVITGTKGKTSVTAMLRACAERLGQKVVSIGTAGAFYGGQYHLLENTSPDPLVLQQHLAKAVEAGAELAFIEVSSQAILHSRVAGLRFDLAILLNLEAGDHVSPHEHPDFEDYARSKMEIVKMARFALINLDSEELRKRLGDLEQACYLSFGESEGCDCWLKSEAVDDTLSPAGMKFALAGLIEGEFRVNLAGHFSVKNAMAALLVLKTLGLEVDEAAKALQQMEIPGRAQMIYQTEALSVCVDFAHNGYSMYHLLKGLKETYKPKRLRCLYGGTGNRDLKRRAEMAEAAAKFSDDIVITTDNLHEETFEAVTSDVVAALERFDTPYRVIEHRREAIETLLREREDGDLLALVGRGDMIFYNPGEVEMTSDEQMVKEWLAKHGG